MKYIRESMLTSLFLLGLFGLFACSDTKEPGSVKPVEKAGIGAPEPVIYLAELMQKKQFSLSTEYQKLLTSNPNFLRFPIVHFGKTNSIFHHPIDNVSNTVNFPGLNVSQQATIETGVGIFIKNADKVVSNGARFRISVQEGEEKKVVLDELVTEFNQWKDISVDLSEFSGKKIDLQFETLSNGQSNQDWAAWGSPRLIQTSINREFVSNEYHSAQRFWGLMNKIGGTALAGGSRTDRGWIIEALTTEILLPELPPDTIVRTEVFVLYPSKRKDQELTISLLDSNGKKLKTAVHGTSKEGVTITHEFELKQSSGAKIHYSVEPESPPILFIKQPVYRLNTQSHEAEPNVILISLDTLRPDHLGCYGNQKNYSPNIDALASESLLFLNAYSSSNWTLPAHTSLFTSLYSTDHQVVTESWGGTAHISFESDYYYVTEAFKEAAYVTLAYTGGGFVDSRYGFNRAFDYHVENVAELNQDTLKNLGNLVDLNQDTPHFLFFHTFEIHDYTNGKPAYRRYVTQPYDSGKLPFERRLSAQHYLDLPSFKGIARGVLPNVGAKYARELYAGAVSHTDELVGSLFDRLRELGLYDHSWIILTSDHGEGFGENHSNGNMTSWRHGRRLYDDQIRIPLIIKPPKGVVDKQFPIVEKQAVELIDIAPTMMAMLGKKPHTQFKGRNLLPAFVKPDAINARVSFSDDIRNKQFAVIADGYKLIASPHPNMLLDTRFELYNLVEDLQERRNRFKDPDSAELLRNLQLMLQDHMKTVSPDGSILSISSRAGEELDEEHLRRLKELGYIQ